jgi:hypothetical protein
MKNYGRDIREIRKKTGQKNTGFNHSSIKNHQMINELINNNIKFVFTGNYI